MPRHLHCDGDAIYGDVVRKRIELLGIEQVVSARKSPWQNPFVERVIGSVRRECTDHLVPLTELHLRKILGEYVAYYNESRCHQSLRVMRRSRVMWKTAEALSTRSRISVGCITNTRALGEWRIALDRTRGRGRSASPVARRAV